jgi:hypothetical protein
MQSMAKHAQTGVLLVAMQLGCAFLAAGEEIYVPIQAFDLSDVRLMDGPCREEQEATRRYLHELDPERLLYTFRKNAGLDAPGEPLGGWEKPDSEVRGHFVGHYVSACAEMYAATGDEELKARADYMVAEMAKCQEALGGEYLSAYPESFFDRLEAMDRIPWAAYYTIHKIMAGLFDVYTLCGNEQALDVLKGMSAYFKKRMDKLTTWQIDRVLTVEFGGMSEVLHNLYGVTKNPDDLALAHTFDQASFLGPLALGHDNLTRIHGNTHIPIVRGAARHYELTGDTRYRAAAEYFWDRVVETRTFATGGSTLWEHWGDPNRLAPTLGALNHECCKTRNMMHLTQYLFRWTGDPTYADFYERAFFNGQLGTVDVDTGQMMYYVPMATGYTKLFGTPNDTFWCCYGTGVEAPARLGEGIYFHDDTGLYVNLFVASTLAWKGKGLRLEQQTRFPDEDTTKLVVGLAKPSSFPLHIRVPGWARDGLEIGVNGKQLEAPVKPSSYATVNREWRDGDVVEVRVPMSLHVSRLPDDPDMMAILYGPLVLAGIVEDGLPKQFSNFHEKTLDLFKPGPKIFFLGDSEHPETWLRPVENQPLTFRTVGQQSDITFIPFHRVTTERYGIYWHVTEEGSAHHQELAATTALQAREVDRVYPRNPVSESAHNQQGEKTSAGPVLGMNACFRDAAPGGWWSWDLRTLPTAPMTMVCTYWGSDGGRTFDILLDETLVATQTLQNDHPGELFTVEYPIPPELTRGKEKVTMKFQPHEGSMAGGVFGCAIRE